MLTSISLVATQNILDPRRLGKQNSGFSDEDISDIICVLYPHSDTARVEVQQLLKTESPYLIGRDEADDVELDYEHEDRPSQFESNPANHGNHAIILRLSSQVHSPAAGFVFGRNPGRCDIVFANDPLRRISNIHFRIFVNEHGTVMIEDQSTNGTFVDDRLLKNTHRDPTKKPILKWMLSSGSLIRIYLHNEMQDLTFRVRIPRRTDEYMDAYQRKVDDYFLRHNLLPGPVETITAGPGGHVDLFKNAGQLIATPRRLERQPSDQRSPTKRKDNRGVRREWNGSGKYNRIGMIGKGAFAVVYKVTSKYDGMPYAAKEIEKRRFIKNGVLDQKVENEMKIMQRVKHPNIVRYMENFDWEDRLLIIIMELVPGGDIGKHVADEGPFPEAEARIISQQLLSALAYLHTNNITHRDVKPDNILINSLSPLEVKLTDFGLSKMVDTEQTFLRTFCGTLLYCAPEVYNEYAEYDDKGIRSRGKKGRRAPGQRYNHAVDIWSLGGVIFYSMTGQPPYPVKSGTSYSELLHQIMTMLLDIRPLDERGISDSGIDFICAMLQRRPENRATVEELDEHPWIHSRTIEASQSFDEITDEEDVLESSQYHGHGTQYQPNAYQIEDEDDRVSDSAGEEAEGEENGEHDQDEKENIDWNYTFGQGTIRPLRLFGEVGVSAVGSSGAVPESQLNLPAPKITGDGSNGSNFEGQDDEAYDSGDSGDSGATLVKLGSIFRPERSVSIDHAQSADQLQSLVENVASQSLGVSMVGIEDPNVSSYSIVSSDFNASKRKSPSPLAASADFDNDSTPTEKPALKRLKSEGFMDDVAHPTIEEYELLSRMPPIQRSNSGRQIDEPVSKKYFWAKDRSTWHLHYPEMTNLQYDAFLLAATQRKEEFAPGKTPLWELAMKYFPPVTTSERQNTPSVQASPDEDVNMEFPPTAPTADVAATDKTDIPDSLRVVPVQEAGQPRLIAMIASDHTSCVRDIECVFKDTLVSFGRGLENTAVYPDKFNSKVPKYAFKVLLWKEGYDPSNDPTKVPLPWKQDLVDEESYHLWISTKASGGIRINGQILDSSDPKKAFSPSKNWTKIYNEDELLVWGDANEQTKLRVKCFWGGSAHQRKDKRLKLATSEVARELDAACLRTEKRIRDVFDKRAAKRQRLSEAEMEDKERLRRADLERERSLFFEQKRLEAIEFLAPRPGLSTTNGSSRRGSPAVSLAPSTFSTRLQSTLMRTSPEKDAVRLVR
ncbi:hypothetical protein GGI43DRAFT_393417 [Trichoderma evansii]